ncbi:MAG: hypothetical protein SFY69_02475 [Planctomycetota bacterium]|nr:hypothetical protein [Planctomycetota bacterium]
MFIFPLYAVLVWYGCFKWRRRFLGVASLVAGLGGVLLLGWVDVQVSRWLTSEFPMPGFLLLLAGEGGIMLLVGSYLVALPRERVRVPCRGCRYELDGLEHANPTCPECGLAHAASKPRRVRCRRCGDVEVSPTTLCARCAAPEPAMLAE